MRLPIMSPSVSSATPDAGYVVPATWASRGVTPSGTKGGGGGGPAPCPTGQVRCGGVCCYANNCLYDQFGGSTCCPRGKCCDPFSCYCCP